MKLPLRFRRPPGMTLPELLVSAALFIALTAVLAFSIRMGILVHDYANRTREAHQAAEHAVQRLTGELRTSASLPTISLGQLQVPSGVLWPDSYGNSAGGFYSLQTLTQADGTPVHVARNRVIFTRPGTSVSAATFDPSDLSNYVYVEWLVPQAAPNRLLRRVHRVVSPGGTTALGHRWDATQQQWVIIPAYFQGGSGLLNPAEQDQVVARLGGETDTVELSVSHLRYRSHLTGLFGVETGFGTTFDRLLFDVNLDTTTVHRDDPNRQTRQRMKGQVRLQSGQ